MKTLALLLLLAGAANAQQCTTLVYTGAPFTSLVTTGSNYNQIIPVMGIVTLAAPLGANLVNANVTPAAWNFSPEDSDYPAVLTSSDSFFNEFSPPQFVFSTDTQGNITSWTVNVLWESAQSGTYNQTKIAVTLTPTGDSVNTSASGSDTPDAPSTITGSNTAAGAWSCPPAPPVNPLAAPLAAAQAQVTALSAQVTTLTAQVASLKAQLAAQTPATSAPSPVVAATPVMIAGTKGGGAFSWVTLLLWGAIPLTVRLRDRLRSG